MVSNYAQARLASLWEPHKGVILQSATGEELSALKELQSSLCLYQSEEDVWMCY
jgi:hypothetical protein